MSEEEVKKESSASGDISGVQQGGGGTEDFEIIRREMGLKKKYNPGSPFGDVSEAFENAVFEAIMSGKSLDEVVRQEGGPTGKWVYRDDDDTEVVKGSYTKRGEAWAHQRREREKEERKRKYKSAEKKRKRIAAKPTKAPEPRTEKSMKRQRKAQKKAKGAATEKVKKRREKYKSKEEVLNRTVAGALKFFKEEKLNERTVYSYIFESEPSNQEALVWEKFVGKLSKDTIMDDPKLKNILIKMAKVESAILGKSVDAISQSLTGYELERGKMGTDEVGDPFLAFTVHLSQSKQKIPLGIKIENSRPFLVFPADSKQLLNSIGNEESKMLVAELMHIQETTLNTMDDVAKAGAKRDKYLSGVEAKTDKLLNSMNSLQVAMLRHLLKHKYKGVK